MTALNATKYLVVGASHAGLEAAAAIRAIDQDGSLTMVTRENHLPLSPTVLPYLVNGRTNQTRAQLRDDAYFERQNIDFRRGQTLVGLDTAAGVATFAGGEQWRYEKLLLATGSAPMVPPVDGLASVPYHVLRTAEDAARLRQAMTKAKSAVVLGAGLVGLHAAETLREAGLDVAVVEMRSQVLPGYFDARAADIIQRCFTGHGIALHLGRRVTAAGRDGATCSLTLDDGGSVAGELLLVATGVRPNFEYLQGSGIGTGQGILVDDAMRTNVANVWAAGDVAQARSFHDGASVLNAILPDAVDQGRIAGKAMCDDSSLKPYPGAVPLNTFPFFGHHAVSVGGDVVEGDGLETVCRHDEWEGTYLKLVLQNGRLRAAAAIDQPFDAGVLWQLILRGVDLSSVKAAFLENPVPVARAIMSRQWR